MPSLGFRATNAPGTPLKDSDREPTKIVPVIGPIAGELANPKGKGE